MFRSITDEILKLTLKHFILENKLCFYLKQWTLIRNLFSGEYFHSKINILIVTSSKYKILNISNAQICVRISEISWNFLETF